MSLETWVSDQLYEILDLSDRTVASFLSNLAKKSASSQALISTVEATGTIDVNHKVRFVLGHYNRFSCKVTV